MLNTPVTDIQEEKEADRHIKGAKPAREGKSREHKSIPITESTASKMELQASECTPHHAWFTEEEASVTCFGRRLVGNETAEEGWVDTCIEMLEDGTAADNNIEKALLTLVEGS